MTRNRLCQQPPPRPRRDQRALPQGKTWLPGGQQQVQAPPPTRGRSPPNPHHGMAKSGARFRARAPCKPSGGVKEEGKWDQQGRLWGSRQGFLHHNVLRQFMNHGR